MNTYTKNSLEAAWIALGLGSMDAFDTMWSSLNFMPGWIGGPAWNAQLQIPKPRTGRYQMYWRFYAEGDTPAAAAHAIAEQLRDLIRRAQR